MSSARAFGTEWNSRRASTIAACAFSTVVPLFLFGAFAGDIRAEIGLSDIEIGVISGAFFASSGIFGIPGGSLVLRIGADRGMLVALGVSLVSLLGLTLLVASAWHLVVFMLLAGAANAVSQTATSSAMLNAVPSRHYGIAFALKQTNGPVASIFASLLLVVVITIAQSGWRVGFGIAITLTTGLLLLSLRLRSPDDVTRASGDRRRQRATASMTRPVVLMLIASTSAAAIAGVLATFFVLFLLSAGLPTARAAGLLSLAGLAGIGGRLVWGLVSDRTQVSLTVLLAAVFTVGSVGLFLLPRAPVSGAITVVAILTFATAGSWQGMMLQRGATASGQTSAGTIGILMTGIGLGGSIGPPAFGALVGRTSYLAAWSVAGCVLAAAALAMLALVQGERSSPVPGPRSGG